MHTLDELRQAIDECDQQLVRWFHRRMDIVLGVADYKRKQGMAIFDPGREQAILERAKKQYGGDFPFETQEFFRSMMKISRSMQAEMLFPYHVILIGFMGAGKTTVGQALADHLGREFVDLDQALETEQGTSIAQIFAERGEGAFRQLETDIIKRYSAPPADGDNHRIIACGGGAVLRPENVTALKTQGRLVFLAADVGTIWQRVGSDPERPLLKGKDGPDALRSLWLDRQDVYENTADLRIDTDSKDPEIIAKEIVEAFGKS